MQTDVAHDSLIDLERAETAAFADMYRAADPAVAEAAGLSVRDIAGSVILAVRHVDVLALNRALGLGVFQAATAAEVDAVVHAFYEIGSPRFFIPIAPVAAAEHVALHLDRVGIRPYNNWMRLSRTLQDVPISTTIGLDIRQIDRSEADAFGRIVADAFGYPAAVAALPAGTIGRPNWRHYMAYEGKTPVATAAVYLAGAAAWFGFAATLASHRGRGAQTALVVRRLADAAVAGCEWVSVETAEDTVLKNAPSFRNLRRLGFGVAYKRPNYLWTRAGAGA